MVSRKKQALYEKTKTGAAKAAAEAEAEGFNIT
jgi:hypothetical protein